MPALRPRTPPARRPWGALGLGIAIGSLTAVAFWPRTAAAELSGESLFGPGLRSRPAYDGSASQHLELVPVIRYLGEPGFLRTTQGVLEGGLRYEVARGLHAGAQVAYEPGRRAGESGFLVDHAVGSIARGVSVGVQLEWDAAIGPMPFTLLARTRHHTDTDQGAQADLRLSAGVFESGRFGAGVFTQATWADARSTRAHYGVDGATAAAGGLAPYAPGSGWLYASAGVLWSFALSSQWLLVGNVETRWLLGDAAQSPLAERRWAPSASAGLAFRY